MSSDRKNPPGSGGKSDRNRPESPSLEPSTLDEEQEQPGRRPGSDPRKTGARPAISRTGQRASVSGPGARPRTGAASAASSPRARPGDATLPASAMAGAVDPSLDGATMMIPEDAPKSGRPAQVSNETVIFDSNRPPPRSLASDDPDTQGRNLASDDRPTAARRPLADLVDGDGESTDVGGARQAADPSAGPPTNLSEHTKGLHGMQLVVAALALLVAAAFTIKVIFGSYAKPSDDQVRLLYPYQQGGVLPNGHPAPAVSEVEINFVDSLDCDGQRCLKYSVIKPGNMFEYEMVLRHDDEGWVLVRNMSGGH